MEPLVAIIPYIENLENFSPDVLSEKLRHEGVLLRLDNAPWSEYPYKPKVKVNVAASRKYLFVGFDVKGLGLKAIHGNINDPVWQDSCVEVFLSDADGIGYHNFEFNCIGTLLSSYRKARKIDVRPISAGDDVRVKRFSSVGRETFEEREGEYQWTLTVGIPFDLLGYNDRPDSLKANFYKCANYSRWPHYLSWSPIDTPAPDFHRPEFFGTLILQPVTETIS